MFSMHPVQLLEQRVCKFEPVRQCSDRIINIYEVCDDNKRQFSNESETISMMVAIIAVTIVADG